MNALVDTETIDALYAASRDGVEIDLIVRGICCLRPQLDGVSDRIRVISIVGRFLEHSRFWYFANGGADEYYLGSADWMPRNFDRRVEAVAPVESPALHKRLRRLLRTYWTDNRQAWELRADGEWTQRRPHGAVRGSHEILLTDSWGLSAEEVAEPLLGDRRRVDVVGREDAAVGRDDLHGHAGELR
jgi:polyphosphate kinase